MVLYDYDSNHIFAQPFKNRTAHCITEAYKILHQRLCDAGFKPKLQRLDNECSEMLKRFLKLKDVNFLLVPPGVHRRNAAERAIRTFQNHFIAGLCSTNEDFPLHLWDVLIPQAELTLNLLRSSRSNPKLSARAHVNGQFDYSRTPLGPPGCRVLAHVKPDDRTTWSPHGLDAWYVGPALDSYRCWWAWILGTRSIRICDTLKWYPTKVTMPHSSSNDIIQAALHNIIHALKHPAPKSPIAPQTDSQTQALLQIVDLLHGITDDNKENTESPASSLRVPIHSKQGPSSKVLNLESAVPAPTLRVRTQPPADTQNADDESTAGPTPPLASRPASKVMDVESAEPQHPNTLHTIETRNDVDVISKKQLHVALPPSLTSTEYLETKHGLPHGALGFDMRPWPAADTTDTAPAEQPPRVTFRNPPVSDTRSYSEVTAPTTAADKLTYDQTTGPLGKKRRRNQRTPKPTKTEPRATQSRRTRKHKASNASKVPETVNAHVYHTFMALHGTAINPDTGNISEYRELSKCSEGQAWK
jgi:hypothetical protein